MGGDLRINQIEIRVSVSLVQGDSIGLSGWRFVPSLTLRTGPQLIDW